MKLYLHRVRLDNGGYTNEGNYYGVGQPLYEYFCDEPDPQLGEIEGELRADNREHAKDKLKRMYPGVEFMR